MAIEMLESHSGVNFKDLILTPVVSSKDIFFDPAKELTPQDWEHTEKCYRGLNSNTNSGLRDKMEIALAAKIFHPEMSQRLDTNALQQRIRNKMNRYGASVRRSAPQFFAFGAYAQFLFPHSFGYLNSDKKLFEAGKLVLNESFKENMKRYIDYSRYSDNVIHFCDDYCLMKTLYPENSYEFEGNPALIEKLCKDLEKARKPFSLKQFVLLAFTLKLLSPVAYSKYAPGKEERQKIEQALNDFRQEVWPVLYREFYWKEMWMSFIRSSLYLAFLSAEEVKMTSSGLSVVMKKSASGDLPPSLPEIRKF